MKKYFSEHIENSGLVIFRILLGLLIASESFGAIILGWVDTIFINSKFSFNFIGFDFLQILHGEKMYVYFSMMGILGILIAIGLFYRFSMILFTIMWAGVYLAQKESYNNHYYFLVLVGVIMCFLPANGKLSLDSKFFPKTQSTTLPRWMPFLLIFQISILYFYAAVAKIYPDWLDGTFSRILLNGITQHQFLLDIFNQKWFLLLYAYAGILFDLFIIPALFWKRTRVLAIIASFAFHISNSITLKIGIFPFLALSFIVLIVDPKTFQFIFKKSETPKIYPFKSNLYVWFFVPFFILQLLFPLRHFVIKGDVLFTEEGHRLSWRMMLRERIGELKIKVVDPKTELSRYYDYESELTSTQIKTLKHSPDLIWQYCQRIKKQYKEPVAIYVESRVSINRRPFVTLIDENVDMTKAQFNYFQHNDWILLQKLD
ncbi:HTTM domain-containing protein [Flavobacterium urocaniciphilum]|uniref:Vitamin K-dependent gamma-carboxylase n=1 Tax=Flavobacterium urocaniciphilum TaxID=1299341 RepID=A0A1H9AGK9_9FLAO|nr:HTTM domain-containing protein [Flavobacterium urocaniciphilum]SEP75876.1 Vitamin K-dependent gamma-carboxylase [Flavobacterium urocaniciphilum]